MEMDVQEQDFSEQEDYEVRIGAFNGPMDLLVYLVQKKEVPLDQISIAEIADQFLKWVEEYSATDLSKAGDFLFMASRLMALKVQELLPAEERDPELEEEYNADREQLMKEMLEYQRFKQVAGGLQEMEGKNFGTYSRGRLEKTQADDDTLADANIWQLFRAYQKSLKTKISETVHHIELDYVTIQDRQQAINNYLSVNGRALFEDLLENDTHPIVAAVTFMAMLEMIKTDEIVFRQSELFGPIWIYRKKNNTEYADEMARETVFFSKDPEVKSGLVDAIRNQAMARSQEQSVGDLAAVMREAVHWAESGRNVSDEDLTAMLEGKVDMSDVQENPFAEMMKEDEKAEAAEGLPTGNTAPGENSTEENSGAIEKPQTEPAETYAENLADNSAEENTDSDFADESVDTSDDEDFVPTVVSASEAAQEPEPATQEPKQMSDEEFAEFMRKAQEFYNQNGTKTNTESSPSAALGELEKAKPEEPAEEKDDEEKDEGPVSYGNEMTDAEYIAYLTRSAKNFGKKK